MFCSTKKVTPAATSALVRRPAMRSPLALGADRRAIQGPRGARGGDYGRLVQFPCQSPNCPATRCSPEHSTAPGHCGFKSTARASDTVVARIELVVSIVPALRIGQLDERAVGLAADTHRPARIDRPGSRQQQLPVHRLCIELRLTPRLAINTPLIYHACCDKPGAELRSGAFEDMLAGRACDVS